MFKFLSGPYAAYHMMLAVVAYSLTPVLFDLGGAEESPMMFTAVWLFSFAMGTAAAILVFKRRLILGQQAIEDIKSCYKHWEMWVSTPAYCGFALFALGLAFVDVSIAAIIFETWPVFWILILSILFSDKTKAADEQRFGAVTSALLFGTLALFGVGLVILSYNAAPNPLEQIGSEFASRGTLLGAGLVVLASICGAADGAGPLKLGSKFAKKHSGTEKLRTRELIFASALNAVCAVIASGALYAIGWSISETLSLHQVFYAFINGFFVFTIGGFAFRAANLNTNDLGVNALAYATPLVTLVWLWMLSTLDVPHLDYLLIGAMGIVSANLLINVKASIRDAYKALVVSLCVFGAIVYFTEGTATDVPLELPVTIFILVLAFRVERLARRTSQEEGWVFEAFRRIEALAYKKQIDKEEWETLQKRNLLKIDRHEKPTELTDAYEGLAEYLSAQAEKSVRLVGAYNEITGVRHIVDKLAHSRQQGSRFGEIVAIFLAGALIVLGLLSFNGGRDVYGEITSFVLSSVIVFLFFNILDLEKDRRDRVLKEKGGRYIVKFDDASNRKGQQRIAVVTSGVIVIVFVALFFRKAQVPI